MFDAAKAAVGSRLKIVTNVKSSDNRRFFIGFIGFSFLKMRNKKSRPCDLLLRES